MTITATKVVEQPTTDVQRQEYVSGSMPQQQASVPTPPPPPPDQPILLAVVVPAPRPAAPAATLPHTGSIFPLVGLLGFVSLAASLALRKFRS
jgi:LPXTG-motif cell wall-anchored protein